MAKRAKVGVTTQEVGDVEGETTGPSRPSKSHGRDTPSPFAPGLYVVATPIGNAKDITLRALELLRGCDALIVEDSRVTAKLLALHGLSRPMLVYNDHTAERMRPQILARLARGERLALVSDAGTPLISDPGFRLVRAAIAAGAAVVPLPGPSALLAALVVAGLPTDRFFFAGFLPPRTAARRAELRALAAIPSTLVFYEAPQRLGEALSDMRELLGARQAAVIRELTKLHEDVRRGSLAELAEHYGKAQVLGEIVVVVGPPEEKKPDDLPAIDARLVQELAARSLKEAVALVAAETGLPRKTVYARALALTRER
jgi:16S rRNA (cytidine1402-2'-O)-methyltransferase